MDTWIIVGGIVFLIVGILGTVGFKKYEPKLVEKQKEAQGYTEETMPVNFQKELKKLATTALNMKKLQLVGYTASITVVVGLIIKLIFNI